MNGSAVPPPGDPLVTIFVAAYNQEEFIADAVRGALTQSYPNVEIILSDDGSRDRTFEIIKAMAAEYRGPHKVITNQTSENRGTLAHLYAIARLSSGALIIAGAGDDVSHPDRVERTVREWQRTAAPCLFSSWDVVDSKGKFLERHTLATDPQSVRMKTLETYFRNPRLIGISGAMASYSREVFDKIELPEGYILEEDYFLTLALTYLGGQIHYFEEQLVSYRRSENSVTHFSGDVDFALYEQKTQRLSRSRALLLRHFARNIYGQNVPRFTDTAPPNVDMNRLHGDIAYYDARAEWPSTSLVKRLRVLTRLDSLDEFRWAVPRIFGTRALFAFKKGKRRLTRAARRRGEVQPAS